MSREYLIEILRRQREQRQRQKTAVLPSRRADSLGRRRLGGIRFFDVGYIKSGANYIDLPYIDPLRSSPITDTFSDPLNPFALNAMTLARYQALEDLAFTVPVAEWKDSYKQIDNSYTTAPDVPIVVGYRGTTYDLSTATAPVWNNGVFKPNIAATDSTFTLSFASTNQFFRNIDLSAQKITTVRDYAASASAFTPSPSMDIFWLPEIKHWTAWTLLKSSPTLAYEDVLGGFVVPFPRRVYLDSSYTYYRFFIVSGIGAYSGLWSGSPDVDTYTRVHSAIRLMQDTQPYFAREYTKVGAFGGPWTSAAPLSAASFMPAGTDYPEPPSEPPYPRISTILWGIDDHVPIAGSLIAVIRQNGTYYYIWQN